MWKLPEEASVRNGCETSEVRTKRGLGLEPRSEALPQERVLLERTWISSQQHWRASESYKWRMDVI